MQCSQASNTSVSRLSVGLTANLAPDQAGINMGEHKQRQLNRRTTNNATQRLKRPRYCDAAVRPTVRSLRSTDRYLPKVPTQGT